jgi:hypothetical protein
VVSQALAGSVAAILLSVQKLLRERLYDGACLLLSRAASVDSGDYLEPHPELTFSKFVTPLVAQVAAVCLSKSRSRRRLPPRASYDPGVD